MSDLPDICHQCGSIAEARLWGSTCATCQTLRVHQQRCGRCGRICGQITDDDHCGPEIVVCPDCLDKVRQSPVMSAQGYVKLTPDQASRFKVGDGDDTLAIALEVVGSTDYDTHFIWNETAKLEDVYIRKHRD